MSASITAAHSTTISAIPRWRAGAGGFGAGGAIRIIAGQNRLFRGPGLPALSCVQAFCDDCEMAQILTPDTLILLIAAPFVGSFLGLLVERLPEGETVIMGRSHCRQCGATLGLRDLVPLLSWAASGGRCRHCHAALGWFHPGIELAAIGVALWSMLVVPGWLAWASAGLGWTLIALAVIDQRHMYLPDVLNLPLIPAGLAVAALNPAGGFWHHLAGAAAGAASLGVVAWTYRRVTGREGLGLGDAKLFAAAGAWVGWQGLPSVLLIGAGSGLAVVLLLGWAKGAPSARDPVAFGPFLAVGLWITWLYGPVTLHWP
jgi:leader peptidase (prepilin peptidase)/N-methyltransferase